MIEMIIIMLCIVLAVMFVFTVGWRRSGFSGRVYPSFLGLIIGVIAALIYGYLGNWGAIDPSERFASNGDVAQFVNAVETLEKKIAQDPSNLNNQLMLAHSYRAMGRYQDAVGAFGRAWQIVKNNPQELTLFASSLISWKGSIQGKPEELIQSALKLDPTNPEALMLAGMAAYERKDYEKTQVLWSKIKVAELDQEDATWLKKQQEVLKQMIREKDHSQDSK